MKGDSSSAPPILRRPTYGVPQRRRLERSRARLDLPFVSVHDHLEDYFAFCVFHIFDFMYRFLKKKVIKTSQLKKFKC